MKPVWSLGALLRSKMSRSGATLGRLGRIHMKIPSKYAIGGRSADKSSRPMMMITGLQERLSSNGLFV